MKSPIALVAAASLFACTSEPADPTGRGGAQGASSPTKLEPAGELAKRTVPPALDATLPPGRWRTGEQAAPDRTTVARSRDDRHASVHLAASQAGFFAGGKFEGLGGCFDDGDFFAYVGRLGERDFTWKHSVRSACNYVDELAAADDGTVVAGLWVGWPNDPHVPRGTPTIAGRPIAFDYNLVRFDPNGAVLGSVALPCLRIAALRPANGSGVRLAGLEHVGCDANPPQHESVRYVVGTVYEDAPAELLPLPITGNVRITGASFGHDGSLVVQGRLWGLASVGGAAFEGPDEPAEGALFIALYEPDGTHRGSRLLEGDRIDRLADAAQLEDGTIAVALDFTGALRLGDLQVDAGPRRGTVIVGFDPGGTPAWHLPLLGAGDVQLVGIEALPGGGFAVAGTYERSIEIEDVRMDVPRPDGYLPTAAFAAAFDAERGLLWADHASGSSDGLATRALDLAVDPRGRVALGLEELYRNPGAVEFEVQVRIFRR